MMVIVNFPQFKSMTYKEFKARVYEEYPDSAKYTDEFLFDELFFLYKFSYEKYYTLKKVTKADPFKDFLKALSDIATGEDEEFS